MGKVIQMKAPRRNQPEVVDMIASLLARAERGHITGIVCVVAVVGQQDEIATCGDFAEDLDYACSAARHGLTALYAMKAAS